MLVCPWSCWPYSAPSSLPSKVNYVAINDCGHTQTDTQTDTEAYCQNLTAPCDLCLSVCLRISRSIAVVLPASVCHCSNGRSSVTARQRADISRHYDVIAVIIIIIIVINALNR